MRIAVQFHRLHNVHSECGILLEMENVISKSLIECKNITYFLLIFFFSVILVDLSFYLANIDRVSRQVTLTAAAPKIKSLNQNKTQNNCNNLIFICKFKNKYISFKQTIIKVNSMLSF